MNNLKIFNQQCQQPALSGPQWICICFLDDSKWQNVSPDANVIIAISDCSYNDQHDGFMSDMSFDQDKVRAYNSYNYNIGQEKGQWNLTAYQQISSWTSVPSAKWFSTNSCRHCLNHIRSYKGDHKWCSCNKSYTDFSEVTVDLGLLKLVGKQGACWYWPVMKLNYM